MIYFYSGGFGCPNVRCYQTDLACLCTNDNQRRRKIQEIIAMPLHETTSTDKVTVEILFILHKQKNSHIIADNAGHTRTYFLIHSYIETII